MYLDGPILDKVKVCFPTETDFSQYPFSLDIIQNLDHIVFPTQVTFLVGENGTGKSSLLEAIAVRAGFGIEGGSKNIHFTTAEDEHHSGSQAFSECMTLSWRKKVRGGYFFRAESFFAVANHIDDLAKNGGQGERAYEPYGGESLHTHSHGESFLAFFENTVGKGGFYIFDEPEAALSPQRQLALLAIMHDLCKHPETQFIIATHSPILLAYPGATIYSCDGGTLKEVKYEDTQHYQITKDVLDNPGQYMKRLLKD